MRIQSTEGYSCTACSVWSATLWAVWIFFEVLLCYSQEVICSILFLFFFWSFLSNPRVLPGFPWLGFFLFFFFSSDFFILRAHRPGSLHWFPSLYFVQVLQSAGLTASHWRIVPTQGAFQPIQGGINSFVPILLVLAQGVMERPTGTEQSALSS